MPVTLADAPPFPRMGEVYRALASALDTRSSADAKHAQGVDKLARKADFNYFLLYATAEILLGKPLRRYVVADLADAVVRSVQRFIRVYADLVAAIPLDGLGRKQVLPTLIEHMFAAQGASFLLFARQTWGGPDVLHLLDSRTQPIAVVLDWLGSDAQGVGVDWIKTLYPGSTGTDKKMKDKLSGWRRGDELPQLQSLDLLTKDMVKKWPSKDRLLANFKRWCLLARALGWFEREASAFMPADTPVRGLMAQELLLGVPTRDVGAALMVTVRETAQPMQKLKVAGLALMESLKRTALKAAGDKDKTELALQAFKQLLCEHDPQGRCSYLLLWAQARWYVLSGQLAKALPAYEAAFGAALYRAGPNQKSIVEELLVVAAQLGKSKRVLSPIKHQAVAFGFFKALTDAVIVEDWESAHFKTQFAGVFPAQGRFFESEEFEMEEKLPFLCLDADKVASLVPHFARLNRVVGLLCADGQKLRRPQLNLFASSGQTEKVRQLLMAGAPVDQLDVWGSSALLAAIQHFESTRGRATMDLLLAQPHKIATLDSATSKKKLTPLICAIECGAPDVVAKLLELGASPNRRATTDGVSPLYRCMTFVAFMWSPDRMAQQFQAKAHQAPDAQMADALRRYGVSMAGVYGDSQNLQEMVNSSPDHRAIFDGLGSSICTQLKTTYTRQSLLTTIIALLKSGANPNDAHGYPIPGYTPLMLAVEADAVEVVDLLLQYGGQPGQPEASGRNCMRIATEFRSREVARYLQRRGVV